MADIVSLKYQFDKLGNLADNFVVEEPHLINQSTSKVVLVTNGLFYTHDFVVREQNSSVPLTAGVDFEFIGQDSYVTAKTNLENASAIQMLNPDISGTYLITHRLVGGKEGMLNTFVSFLIEALEEAKNSTVEFVNVRNRPFQYPPEEHTHVLADLQRWEGVTTLMSQIRDAIIDSRSLGSSALNLANQDQRLLQLIAELQGEVNTLSLRLGNTTKQIDKFQRFDTDFGDLKETARQNRWGEVDTFRIGTIDLNDPYGRRDPESPIPPAMITPASWSKGTSRSPLIVGSFLVTGTLRTIHVPLTVFWSIKNKDGLEVFTKTAYYDIGQRPTIDLLDERVELERGERYTVDMRYVYDESAWPLDSMIPRVNSYDAPTAWFEVSESRIDQLTLNESFLGSSSKAGSKLSVSADGLLVAMGVGVNDGSTSPYLYYATDEGWQRLAIPVPVEPKGDGTFLDNASSVLLDPRGGWLMVSGPDAKLVRRYQIASLREANRRYRTVELNAPTAIQEPGALTGRGFGGNMAVSGNATYVVIAATKGDGAVVIYSSSASSVTALQTLDFDDSTSRLLGGLGKQLAISNDGNVILAASPDTQDAEGLARGAVKLIRRFGAQWTATGMFTDATASVGGKWGDSIAMDGDGIRVAISEPLNNEGKGFVHLYELDKETMVLTSSQKLYPSDEGGKFGDVAISNDGRSMAISAGASPVDDGSIMQYRLLASGKFASRGALVPANEALLPHDISYSNGGDTLTFASDALGYEKLYILR